MPAALLYCADSARKETNKSQQEKELVKKHTKQIHEEKAQVELTVSFSKLVSGEIGMVHPPFLSQRSGQNLARRRREKIGVLDLQNRDF